MAILGYNPISVNHSNKTLKTKELKIRKNRGNKKGGLFSRFLRTPFIGVIKTTQESELFKSFKYNENLTRSPATSAAQEDIE